MRMIVFILPLLLAQVPKHNPNGVWEAATGSRYEIHLKDGKDLHVNIVPGSNPKFAQYEVDLKNEDEINTYSGKGFFVAKMEGGKECKFPTQWRFVVVSPDRIIGLSSNIIADSKTCEIKEQTQSQLDLKKSK